MKRMFLRKSPRNTTTSNVQPVSAQDALDLAYRQAGQTGTPTDPTALFAQTRERGIRCVEEYIQELSAALREGEFAALAALWDGLTELPYHVGVVATAHFALTQEAVPPTGNEEPVSSIPEYLISTRFLTKCYHYLTADSRGFERMHLVTGVQPGANRYTLDHMEQVALETQSATGARADQNALNRLLIEMDDLGDHLHAIFHSHPGRGPGATFPSSHMDIPTHRRFEEGGYPLIGCIFVKGGYLRFFSTNRPFRVTIYGKGVEPVPGEKNVYKIQNPETRCVSYETLETEEGR